MRPQSSYTPWAPLLLALLGLAWCGYVAFPTANPAPCATSGCELFRDTRVAGISLWWVGGAYFFVLSVLCLKGSLHLARLLATLALLGDMALLLIMFFTAPCFDCLVVAVFIGLCYYALRNASDSWFASSRPTPSILLPLWLGLFIGNAALAANEQFPLYALGNSSAREVRVFFSPSCPACRTALVTLGSGAALIPVMEKDEDFDSIVKFRSLLERGEPMREALVRSLNDTEPMPDISFVEKWLLGVRLMRNKAALFKQGFRALPLVQINGMPTGMDPRHDEAPAPRTEARGLVDGHEPSDPALPDFLNNLDNIAQCGGDNPEPCE